MKKIIPIILFLLGSSILGFGQSLNLKQYIEEALQSNIALKQKNLSYEKSLAALQEAKALFFPQFSVQARFSMARGGRTIDFPVGDLLNPAYDNLNLINSINQATVPDYPVLETFPQIANEETNFLRRSEQETVVRLAMPVFNSAILYNHRIQENLAEVSRMSVSIYTRELIKEVKTAYFNYAKTQQAVELFNNTLELVNENLRTTESLHKNHKVTIDEVYAAKTEVARVEQQLAEANKNEKVAKAYFNFLLNRDHEEPIDLSSPEPNLLSVATLEETKQLALQNREELQQLNYYMAVSDQNIQLNKGNLLPTVNLVADYGIQGTTYSFERDADFFLGSLVMSWNFLDFSNKSKVQQAKIERFEVEQQKQEVQQQIQLQVVQAFYNLEATIKTIDAAKAEQESADKAFKLIRKRYEQGQANLVTLTDARTKLTNAQQSLIIAKFDYQIKLAELERVSAL